MKKYISSSKGYQSNLYNNDAKDFDDVMEDVQILYNVVDRIKWAIEQMQSQVDNDDGIYYTDFLETAFSDLHSASVNLKEEAEAVYKLLVLYK